MEGLNTSQNANNTPTPCVKQYKGSTRADQTITKLPTKMQRALRLVRKNLCYQLRKSKHLKTVELKRILLRHARYLQQIPMLSKSATALCRSKIFYQSQLKNCCKKVNHSCYTIKEKIFFLSLYKQYPEAYKLMSQVFNFPPYRTLNRDLLNFDVGPGINEKLFSCLRRSIKKTSRNKICLLMFHQIPLTSPLYYATIYNKVIGLESIIERRRVTDRVLVFMLRGLAKRWKQPIAYYIIQAGAKKDALKNCIHEVVTAIQEKTNLKIIATVCNGAAENIRTIKELCRENNQTHDLKYKINGKEIIHVFDVPFIIKVLRNNFIGRSIMYEGNTIAKWSDIMILYNIDTQTGFRVGATRLTRAHIDSHGQEKLKVKLAAQLFSRTVCAIMMYMKTAGVANYDDTAWFIYRVTNLFDRLNSKTKSEKRARRCLCHRNENYVYNAFNEDIKSIESWRFLDENGATVPTPPSVSLLAPTIRSVQYIWQKLKKFRFRFLPTRNLNLHPLENFFGVARGLLGTNQRPTSASFIEAYKIILLNRIMINRKYIYCEVDNLPNLLLLHKLFDKKNKSRKRNVKKDSFPSTLLSHSLQSMPEKTEVGKFELPTRRSFGLHL